MMKKISIIVPCYNEEETISVYYDEVIKYFTDDYNWNIIFINDGSKDKTLDILREYSKKDSRVNYVSLSRNFGKEAAMYAGLDTAYKTNCDMAIIMDVDLQDPPHIIPQLIEAHNEGYNLIYTKHKNRHGAKILSTIFSLAFYKVYAFITKDKGMAKGARDFCLLDRKAVKAFLDLKDFERFTKGIYHYVGFRTKCIEFDYAPRSKGSTKWNFNKLFHYALLGIREFSRFYEYIPKIFAYLTFFLLLFDIGRGIYLINNNGIFPWSDIRLDIFMFAIFLTIFYVCRLIYEVRNHVQNRPIYILEETNLEIEEK